MSIGRPSALIGIHRHYEQTGERPINADVPKASDCNRMTRALLDLPTPFHPARPILIGGEAIKQTGMEIPDPEEVAITLDHPDTAN